MAKYQIYGIGAALVDTEIEVQDHELSAQEIEKGLMTLVDEKRQEHLLDHFSDHLIASRRASGGSAANTIIAASYFGAKTFYSCKVADDDNGRFYLNDLAEAGVDYHHNGQLPSGTTGKCLVFITPDAERSMNTFLGISETICPNNIHGDALANSEYLYVEGYLVTSETGRPAAIEARKLAEKAGVKTSISLSDPGMVQFFRDGLEQMIGGGVDLLFCNRDEALHWGQTESLDEAVASLKKISKQFAITLGAEGALLFDGNEIALVDAPEVKAIDTNGAGDMFAGAFLSAITRGATFTEAGKLACKAAAKVVSQFGPRLKAEQHQDLLR